MKTHSSKLKTTPRPLFSCGFFRHCTQTVLSPTNPNPPVLPLPHPHHPPPPPESSSPPRPLPPSAATAPQLEQPPKQDSESSSSSSHTSHQSFTQWRFSHSPISNHLYNRPESDPSRDLPADPPPGSTDQPPTPALPPVIITDLQELYHVAELQLSTGLESDRVQAIHMLEHSLVPNPRAAADGGASETCPASVMRGVLGCLKERAVAKPATKVLLALCLAEGNRHVAVEGGAVGKVVEALVDLEDAAAERALAALELLCMVAEGAEELRTHALVVPVMVEAMRRMERSRGKEYAISILAIIFGGTGKAVGFAPQEEVARVVMLALQGDCSARGRRKGAQLLKILQDNGRSDLTQEEG